MAENYKRTTAHRDYTLTDLDIIEVAARLIATHGLDGAMTRARQGRRQCNRNKSHPEVTGTYDMWCRAVINIDRLRSGLIKPDAMPRRDGRAYPW
jgi:hypothetical protein